MKTLWQTVKMAVENILRNKLVNFLCLGIIAFTLLVLGIFQVVSFNLNRYIGKISQNISAILYVREGATAEQLEEMLRGIRDSLLVQEAHFVSSGEAKGRFTKEFPELSHILSEFKESPFPASIEVRFKESSNPLTQIESFLKETRKSQLIESVQLNTDWAKRIERLKSLIAYIGLFLSLILVFVTIFVVYNVIKLNIFYRKDEIGIFRLVGATNLFIRLPFLIEGLLLGTLGACLAGFFLFLVLRLFSMYGGFLLDVIRGMIDIRRAPLAIYLRLLAFGAPIGFLSALFSLQKFLKPPRSSV